MLSIDVYSTRAVIRSQEPLTVGLVGAAVHFRFSDQWKSLVKTVVFRQGTVTRDVMGISNQAVIPWEVLQEPGLPVHVGVYGSDSSGKVVIPTVWAVTDPVTEGADPAADVTLPPTPEVTQQLQNQIGSLSQLNTNAKGSLVAAINEANRGRYTVSANADGTVNRTVDELTAAYQAGNVLMLYDGGYLCTLEAISKDGDGKFIYTFRCHDKWGDQRICKVSYPNQLSRSMLPAMDLSAYGMLGKVGIIGDSLSVGVEDVSADQRTEIADHSWGAYLSREAGNPCLLLGFSGATSATWVRDKLDWALQEENRCDAYIVGLGFNDLRYYTILGGIGDITDSDTYTDGNLHGSYYFNMGKILRKLHSCNPDAPIFVLTNPEYLNANAEMFNQALRTICATYGDQYNAHLIDLKATYGPVFENLEAVRGPGNHFDRQTYAYIGQIIGTAITRDIQKNPTAYPKLKGYLSEEVTPTLSAVFTVSNNGDGTVNRTVDELTAAYQAKQSLRLYDGGYLAALEGIGKDGDGKFVYTFRCHDSDGKQRVYKVSYPNTLTVTVTGGSSGTGINNVFSLSFTTEEDLSYAAITVPVDLSKTVIMNVHMTFQGVAAPFDLYADLYGGGASLLGKIPAGQAVGAHWYWLKHSGQYGAYSFTTDGSTPINAKPGAINSLIKVAENRCLMQFYTLDEAVIPAGTTFEIWGVCEQ